METCGHIADLLGRTFDGEAWHGDSITCILQGVESEKALQKSIQNVHSIWEIVLHMIAWEQVVVSCLQTETYKGVRGEQNWPRVKETSHEAWQSTLKRLAETTSKLKKLMLSFPETRLHEKVPGQNFTFYRLFHGVIQHNLCHGGQIAILKK